MLEPVANGLNSEVRLIPEEKLEAVNAVLEGRGVGLFDGEPRAETKLGGRVLLTTLGRVCWTMICERPKTPSTQRKKRALDGLAALRLALINDKCTRNNSAKFASRSG